MRCSQNHRNKHERDTCRDHAVFSAHAREPRDKDRDAQHDEIARTDHPDQCEALTNIIRTADDFVEGLIHQLRIECPAPSAQSRGAENEYRNDHWNERSSYRRY